MTKAQAIARLEALLGRVRSRAGAPRVEVSAAAPHLEVVADAPETVPMEVPEPSPPPPYVEPDAPPSPRAAPAHTEADIVLDVDVAVISTDAAIALPGEEVALLTVPAEEVSVPDALESRERLVAAEPFGLESPATATRGPDVEASDDLLAELGVVEEPPASSRRPLAPAPEERIADIAFGAEEPKPPRHTPPPESGRLPAAPDDDFDAELGDITGVREAAKPPQAVEIVPEATLPELAASDAVADLVGAGARHRPTTFVALLDESIAL